MGKRNGAVSLQDYRARGYLPEAIVNFIILMAWHPKDDRELFTLEELLKEFELGRIGKSGAILDETKLNWINKEYLKKLSDAEYENGILAFKPDSVSSDLLKKLLPDLKERVNVFGELTAMAEAGEFDFYTNAPSPNEALIVSNTKVSIGEIKEYMAEVARILEGVEMFSKENIKAAIWDFATEKGRGNVLWPMRVILTGKEKSPDPFTVAETLGKEETIKRLANVK
jgi:glutamyl-tRNA synthetase